MINDKKLHPHHEALNRVLAEILSYKPKKGLKTKKAKRKVKRSGGGK